MKKLLLILMALFLWAGSSWAQTQYTVVPTGGTAGNTNGTGGDPVCRYFNSIRYQVVYTVDELTTAGIPANFAISRLAWNVTESSVSLGNYYINMGHTTATNSAAHNVDATTTVKYAFTYSVATGYNDIIFDQPFIWNGSSNIIVEICTGPSNPYTSPYGGVQAKTGVTNGSRQFRVDGSSACAVNTSVVNTTKPYVRFTGTVAAGPTNPTAFTATTVSTSQINLGWALNGAGNAVMLVWNSTNTFGTPEDGTTYGVDDEILGGGIVLQNNATTSFNHTPLPAGTTYFYKAFSVDGTVTYSGGVTANATTWVCDPASQCNYTVTMIDSYGDGWDGTVLGFKQNGIVIGTFGNGFTSGSTYGPVNVPLCPNLMTEIVVVNVGAYVGEKGFTVYAPYGDVVFNWPTGGSFSAATVFHTFFSFCELPDVDLNLSEFYQNTGLPTPNANFGMNDYSVKMKQNYNKPWDVTTKLVSDIQGVPASLGNYSVLVANNKSTKSITLNDIEVNAVVENLGLDAASYILNWDVNGVDQNSHNGPSIDPGESDAVSLSYTPTERGTFLANGEIDVTSDENPFNNVKQFRMRVYPDVYTRIIYDRGDNIVDTYVGWNNPTIAMKAAVRYTASDYIKPVGVDFICSSEAVTSGTYTVELRAAGTTNQAPGDVLYTKDFTTPVYFSEGAVYLHFAFDENEIPTIAPGSDYWIAIQCPLGVLYPGGVHNTGFTAGRSFYYVASTSSWTPLIITTERAWIMRSVEVQGELPECIAPTAPSTSNIVATGAQFNWTSVDSFFDVFVVPTGDPAPDAGSTPTANDVSNPYTWSDGQGNTKYDWYVRTDCGQDNTDVSTWTGPVTFTTIASVPFFDGFETGNTHNVAISGWTQEAVVGTNIWTANNTFTDYNRTPRTGSWNAFLRYGNTRWMFKAIYLTEGVTYNFEMYARQDGATAANSNITVSYGTAGNAAAMTNPIVPVTGIINGNYQLLSGSFSPPATGIYYIGVMGYMNSSPWYISIDDISITEASTATLSYYNLQWPASATINITENETIYAQCWESGVTEPDGPGAGIECWIGYNTTNATVVSDFASGWNWVSTAYNYGADDPGFNNDEYMANLGVAQGLSVGTYYYVSRFRYNGGPFTYGGYPNGAWDGTTQVSGVLTVNPLPNDECSGAITVACGDAVTGTTNTATLDNVATCGVTNTQPGVWYKFTGIGDMVSVDLCTGTTWDSKISVFEGPCESLVCVDGNDDYCSLQSRVDWFAENGVDYYILVHQYSTTGGAFTLTVNCTYPTTATWQGDDFPNNDWFGADNWDVADVPGSTTNVIVPASLTNYPTVDRKGTCNDIYIASGARLVDMGAGYLVPNGTATVDRDYTGGEWHLISAPVSGATANMFLGLYLQKHMESTNAYYDITDVATPLNVMQGYALWNDLAGTASFVGTLNTGYFGFGATRNGQGWNLVGNPYPSPIDWYAATGWTKTNINDATYRHVNNATWAEFVGGVGANGGTRYIAPEQGFFVEVTSGETIGTLAMTNDVRTHTTATFFKDEVSDIVRLEVSGNGYINETVIRFLDIATPGFDGQWDAHKLFGIVPEAPAIYSVDNGMMAINSLPATNTVPVGVKAGVPGEFTMTATETSDFADVILEDLMTGTFTDLKSTSYTFIYDMNFDNRFIVHFTPLAVGENAADLINIYSSNKDVYVSVPANTKGDIVVYNLMGQEVARTLITEVLNKITLDISAYYLVKVMSNESVVTKKVFVK